MEFIFPKGVRFPKDEEIPNSKDKAEMIKKITNAKIEVGFTLTESGNDNYKFYAEINVSAPKIWSVFRELVIGLLPNTVAPILGKIDDEKGELFYGEYLDREKILKEFSEFEYELTNDGFIQFGIIHQMNGLTEEIFVHPSKHFVVWTNNENKFRNIMESFSITEYEQLSFIDEFPRTTLANYEGQLRDHEKVLNDLKRNLIKLSA